MDNGQRQSKLHIPRAGMRCIPALVHSAALPFGWQPASLGLPAVIIAGGLNFAGSLALHVGRGLAPAMQNLRNNQLSGSGGGCWNPLDQCLGKAAEPILREAGNPALESRVRVLSSISYKKWTRKNANGLPDAPRPELSAETCVRGTSRAPSPTASEQAAYPSRFLN